MTLNVSIEQDSAFLPRLEELLSDTARHLEDEPVSPLSVVLYKLEERKKQLENAAKYVLAEKPKLAGKWSFAEGKFFYHGKDIIGASAELAVDIWQYNPELLEKFGSDLKFAQKYVAGFKQAWKASCKERKKTRILQSRLKEAEGKAKFYAEMAENFGEGNPLALPFYFAAANNDAVAEEAKKGLEELAKDEESRPWYKRHWKLLTAGVAGIMVAAGAGAYYLAQQQKPPAEEEKEKSNLNILVVPVTTSDVPTTELWSSEKIYDETLSHENNKSLYNWLKQTSYGKVKLGGTVTQPIILPGEKSDYTGNFNFNRWAPGPPQQQMVKDTVAELDKIGIDFRDYDANYDGKIDHLLVFTPPHMVQQMTEKTSWNTHYFHEVFAEYDFMHADGVWINQFTFMDLPADSDVYGLDPDYDDFGSGLKLGYKEAWRGTLLHELVHALPLYSNSNGILYHPVDAYGGFGPFDPMSGGQRKQNNGAADPAFLAGWHKYDLGYLTPHEVKFGQNGTVRIYQTEEAEFTNNTKLIKIPMGDIGQEENFLLLEWRNGQEYKYSDKHNFDLGLPTGLAVYNKTKKVVDFKPYAGGFTEGDTINPWLVDATPGDEKWYHRGLWKDPLFTKGMTGKFSPGAEVKYDAGTGKYFLYTHPDLVEIKVLDVAEDGSWADLQVNYIR